MNACVNRLAALWGRLFPGLVWLLFLPDLRAATPIHFSDATESSGIRFIHTDGGSGRRYIMETVASGLGLIDFDNDGWPDILFLNGLPLPGATATNPPPKCALYRNNRDGTFTDTTERSGVGEPIYGLGCAVADYDNDGYEDVFITGYGFNRLLHNNRDGTFSEVTQLAGLGHSSYDGCVGAGCVFFDFDRDGWIDLYIGHYLKFQLPDYAPALRAHVPVYANPRSFPEVASKLYRNHGDGTFEDVSESSGIARFKGYAMGVVSADFDGDGWPDLYVGNDVTGNFLFHNLKNGTFEEIGVLAGVAYDSYGDPQGTMGANVGDYDGDGRFDIIVTDYQNQVNTLYRNLGKLQFKDVTVETGAGTGSRPLVTWGCGLVDFDNDGTLELFTAAGHLQDTVEQYDRSTTYKQHSLLLQQRSGRFTDISNEVGGPLLRAESSRGAVFGDLNNDGKIDLVVLNARAKPTVMLNTTVSANHWATLKLIGTRSNRSAIGAWAKMEAGGRTQVEEVRAGRGYQSAEDLRLHFGLGTNTLIDRLEIRWPGGSTQVLTGLAVDKIIPVKEGATP
jgi:enediyne biosynthesis protein E4